MTEVLQHVVEVGWGEVFKDWFGEVLLRLGGFLGKHFWDIFKFCFLLFRSIADFIIFGLYSFLIRSRYYYFALIIILA